MEFHAFRAVQNGGDIRLQDELVQEDGKAYGDEKNNAHHHDVGGEIDVHAPLMRL